MREHAVGAEVNLACRGGGDALHRLVRVREVRGVGVCRGRARAGARRGERRAAGLAPVSPRASGRRGQRGERFGHGGRERQGSGVLSKWNLPGAWRGAGLLLGVFLLWHLGSPRLGDAEQVPPTGPEPGTMSSAGPHANRFNLCRDRRDWGTDACWGRRDCGVRGGTRAMSRDHATEYLCNGPRYPLCGWQPRRGRFDALVRSVSAARKG